MRPKSVNGDLIPSFLAFSWRKVRKTRLATGLCVHGVETSVSECHVTKQNLLPSTPRDAARATPTWQRLRWAGAKSCHTQCRHRMGPAVLLIKLSLVKLSPRLRLSHTFTSHTFTSHTFTSHTFTATARVCVCIFVL